MAAIASGTRVKLVYINEVTRGTTPATPTMLTLRATQRDPQLEINPLKSAEVRSDRQVSDVRHGFNKIAGTIGFEFGMATFDDMLISLLGGAWTSNVLKVGTTLSTFTLERQFPDITQYQLFKGVNVTKMTLSVKPEQIVTGTFDLVGISGGLLSATSGATAVTAAGTHAPFSSFEGTLSEGGSPIAVVTAVDLMIDNGRTTAPVVGSKYTPDVFDGTCKISGTLMLFFQNATIFTKYTAETESSLDLTLLDLNGTSSMEILLPRLKYMGAPITPPPEGPINISFPFEALVDSGTGSTIVITRVP